MTRRSLLQAAAAVLTGGAIAPKLIAADPVATEYGRLGRARYIFPVDVRQPFANIEKFEKLAWNDDGKLSIEPQRVDISLVIEAHALITVVKLDYHFHVLQDGREFHWHWRKNYEGGREYHLKPADSLNLIWPMRTVQCGQDEQQVEYLPSTVTVHGIVSKQDAPAALRLA